MGLAAAMPPPLRDSARRLGLELVGALLVTCVTGQGVPWSLSCPSGCGGTNILVSADGQVTELTNQNALQSLPLGTEIRSSSFSGSLEQLDGTIVVAGPLSLNPSNVYYPTSQVLPAHSPRSAGDARVGRVGEALAAAPMHPRAFARVPQQYIRAHALFGRWLNTERGGISLGGQRFGVAFQFVGDGSSTTQVTNSTAHALRTVFGSHFAVGGYSTELTSHAAKQSYADGKASAKPTWLALVVRTTGHVVGGRC